MEDSSINKDDIYIVRSDAPGFGRLIVHNKTTVTI